jgi:K+-sensing histidine kinase KdpD
MQVGLFIAVVLLLIAAGFLYYLNTQHSIDSKEIALQTAQLKEHVEQNEKQRIQLEQANENSTRLLKLLKSDIRKPIDDTIRNLETLMHQSDSAARLYETCSRVVADLQLTNQLIDNLLFWSNKTTHRIQAGFEIVNLRNCLSDEMYLLASLAKAKSIVLINELPESQVVYADPQLIQMSMRNLVLSEIKNAAIGAVIKVDAHRVNGHVEVRVNHSGKTLSPDAIASLFDEKQLYQQQPEVGQIANGLSLLLSRDVIQKNRGHIRVTSDAAIGTTYHFTLQSV